MCPRLCVPVLLPQSAGTRSKTPAGRLLRSTDGENGPLSRPDLAQSRSGLVGAGAEVLLHAPVAILDSVVKVLIGDGPEGRVVEALKAERLLQIFLKIVQGTKLLRERRVLASGRSDKKLLIASVNEITQLVADRNARFADSGCLVASIFKRGSTSMLGHARST